MPWNAISNLITGVINTAVDGAQNAKNLEWTKEAFQRQQDFERQMAQEAQAFEKSENELAFEREKEMWNLQNDYNSPAEQMRRYQDAGLSPYLIYGQGTPGNSNNMPNYSATSATKPQTLNPPQLPTFKSSLPTNLNLLEGYQILANVRNTDASTNLIKEQTQTQMAETLLKRGAIDLQEFEKIIKGNSAELSTHSLKNQKDLSDIEVKMRLQEFDELVRSYDRKVVEDYFYSLGLEGDNAAEMFMRFITMGLITDFSGLRNILDYYQDKYEKNRPSNLPKSKNKVDFKPTSGPLSGLDKWRNN